MTTAIKLGAVSLDAVTYGSQGSAVLGIRDSGKTFTATLLAERLFEAGVPFVAFDPIGVWRFLRVPGSGRGYPVVVAGGQEGDLPLTVAGAAELVRAAMMNGVSLVIDLFDINLSKADWKRIVTACVRVLLHENARHGLRHVFIEEAAEFVPQRVGPDQGQVYAEIEKLARMGGNARLGYTLINQRAEEVNKAVLELCDNLFLHRQKGRNSLTALSKWLDIGNVRDHREIIDSLATLPTGECWAWLARSDRPVRVKVPAKNSLHPDRRVMRGDAAVTAKAAVDVAAFVDTMRGTLKTVEAEAAANDPKRLRLRIAEPEKELSRRGKVTPTADAEALRRAREEGRAEGERYVHSWLIESDKELARQLEDGSRQATALLDRLRFLSTQIEAGRRPPATIEVAREQQPRTIAHNVGDELHKPSPATHAGNGVTRPGTSRQSVRDRILGALAELAAIGIDRPPRVQVAFLARYSNVTSPAFRNPLGALRSEGLVDYPMDGTVALTEAGRKAAPRVEPIGTAELHQRIFGLLPGVHRRILSVLIEHHPRALARERVAELSGYGNPTSPAFRNPLGRLRALGFATYPASGQVAAGDVLFLPSH